MEDMDIYLQDCAGSAADKAGDLVAEARLTIAIEDYFGGADSNIDVLAMIGAATGDEIADEDLVNYAAAAGNAARVDLRRLS